MNLPHYHFLLARSATQRMPDVLIGTGVVLLGFSLFGLLHTSTNGVSSLVSQRRLSTPQHQVDAEYSLSDYLETIRRNKTAFHPLEATRRVYCGTLHSNSRRVHPAENWMQWALGLVYPPLARSQDTERLIAGKLANCSERSQILKTIAEAAGCDCRFVGLQGHVALEIAFQDQWHLADPDYGVVFPHSIGQVQQDDYLPIVREQLTAAGHNPVAIENYLSLLNSRHDNAVLPTGSPLSPRLYTVEQLCRRLTWVIPLTFLSYGWLLFSRRNPHSALRSNPHPGDGVPSISSSSRHCLRSRVGRESQFGSQGDA